MVYDHLRSANEGDTIMNRADRRILVVEDEVLIGMMLAKKLRARGYLVEEIITTGEEAIIKAEQLNPTVILMDVTLAGKMSGIEAAKEIKQRLNIPSIIFTGYNDSELHNRAQAAAPVAILTKMDPFSAIVSAIEKASS